MISVVANVVHYEPVSETIQQIIHSHTARDVPCTASPCSGNSDIDRGSMESDCKHKCLAIVHTRLEANVV